MKPLRIGRSRFPSNCFLINDLVLNLSESLLLHGGSGQTTCWGDKPFEGCFIPTINTYCLQKT